MSLHPYPEYKETAVPFVGELPSSWNVERLQVISRLRKQKNPGNLQLLSIFLDRGIIRYSEGGGQVHAPSLDLSNYQIVHPGDFVLNNQQAWRGSVGVSKYLGIISPAYIVLELSIVINPRFGDYLFRSPTMVSQYVMASRGVGDIQRQIYAQHLLNVLVPIPPPDEQAAIVTFLDAAEKRIRRYIRAKQTLIKLLNEQKQAIIQQAVTRGLDPDVPMKDSGVEGFDSIPSHWETFAMKFVFQAMDYGISDASTDDGAIPVLTMGNIKDGEITIPEAGGVDSVDEYLLLDAEDLLFNRTNSAELVGKVGIFRGHESPVTFASYLVRLRCNQRSVPEYMNYLLNSIPVVNIARSLAIPSLHQSNLNPTRYGRIPLCFPPHEEQVQIAKYLKQQLEPIETTIVTAQETIASVREYRTRLFADVVTGKVDVRGVAFEMPEQFDESDLPEVDEDEFLEDEDVAETDNDFDGT